MLAVSLRPLAVETHRDWGLNTLLNASRHLSPEALKPEIGCNLSHQPDFERFVQTMAAYWGDQSLKLLEPRARHLFALVYQSGGHLKVSQVAEAVGWSVRSINRYFNKYLGLSLKSYLSLIRLTSTFGGLKQGDLNPNDRFYDQSHYIHATKERTGTTPKALARNQDDRFIQLSVRQDRYTPLKDS